MRKNVAKRCEMRMIEWFSGYVFDSLVIRIGMVFAGIPPTMNEPQKQPNMSKEER